MNELMNAEMLELFKTSLSRIEGKVDSNFEKIEDKLDDMSRHTQENNNNIIELKSQTNKHEHDLNNLGSSNRKEHERFLDEFKVVSDKLASLPVINEKMNTQESEMKRNFEQHERFFSAAAKVDNFSKIPDKVEVLEEKVETVTTRLSTGTKIFAAIGTVITFLFTAAISIIGLMVKQ